MKPFDDSLMHLALERYHFDEESGCFFHIVRGMDGEPVISGKFAGTTTPTGIRLTVGNRHVMAHHLAWRIYKGEWPIANIKQWDGDVSNCKEKNLYSPQAPKKIKERQVKDAERGAKFLQSIGITQVAIRQAMLNRIRHQQGESAYIEAMHIMKMISDDQKAGLLRELRENTNN